MVRISRGFSRGYLAFLTPLRLEQSKQEAPTQVVEVEGDNEQQGLYLLGMKWATGNSRRELAFAHREGGLDKLTLAIVLDPQLGVHLHSRALQAPRPLVALGREDAGGYETLTSKCMLELAVEFTIGQQPEDQCRVARLIEQRAHRSP